MLVTTFLLLSAAYFVQSESPDVTKCDNSVRMIDVNTLVNLPEMTKKLTELQKTVYDLQKKNDEIERALAVEKISAITIGKDELEKPERTQNRWTKENLLQYLKQIFGSKIISGVMADSLATDRNQQIKKIQGIAGVLPGVVGLQFPKYSASKTEWNSFIKDAISHWNYGSLVKITWRYGNPFIAMGIFTYKDSADREKKWSGLIQEGGAEQQVWKRQLELIVPYLKQMQNAGVIPIMDFFSLINTKGFVWRGRPGVNGTAKLYQLTHDYLTKQHNLTSHIWSWCLYYEGIPQSQEHWPGIEYVDVVTVYMDAKKQLSMDDYQKLLDVVGDKPLSMEFMYYVPTLDELAVQTRWTWFTASASQLNSTSYNDINKVKTTFNSISVINRGEIDYFKATN